MILNFWERVEYLLKKEGLSRKELAYDAEFNVSNIRKGIVNGNIPSAETAVKIAKVLNTTVEYLVTGIDKDIISLKDEEMHLYKEYSPLLHYLDMIPEKSRRPIVRMIMEMSVDKL